MLFLILFCFCSLKTKPATPDKIEFTFFISEPKKTIFSQNPKTTLLNDLVGFLFQQMQKKPVFQYFFKMSFFGLFSFSIFLLVFAGFFTLSASQIPNTDGFFVSEFLRKMGVSSQSFNFSATSCSWKVVLCDTQQENVIGLVVSSFNLSGPIPENTIGKLRKLQNLDLSNNFITGFSSDFWDLGNTLKNLNVSSNQISGPLPNNIGNLGLLQTLDLSLNNLSGSVPSNLISLSALQVLNLSRNRFEGNIPVEILGCKSLVSIDLSSNRLNGSVPVGFGSTFPQLRTLNLAKNDIHGRIIDFSDLNSLVYLNLSGNFFQGSVTGIFMKPLEIIDLSQNHFQGHISAVYYNSSFNWSRVFFLDVSENQLSGEIFIDWNKAQFLKHLSLAHNRFSKQKFPRLDKLLNVEYLNLSGTSVTGPIPSEISKLASLRVLDLSQNFLSGHIPNLSSDLDILDLSWNNLTGEIPLSLEQKLSEMAKFNLSYNNLTFCSSTFSPKTFKSAFFGLQDDCPVAVNPKLLRKNGTKHSGLKLVLGIALSALCFLASLICLAFGCRRRTRLWAIKQVSYREEQSLSGPFSFQTDSTTWVADVRVATSVPVIMFEKPLLNFTFADLLAATSNFDRGTLLAEGRFGPVYRGILAGGLHVAVKVLVHGSTITDQEAATELENLGRIKHPNLVPLTGYCLAGDQRIAIYEYMENGNLQTWLHDLPFGVQTTEDWSNDTWEDDNGGRIVGGEGLSTWKFRHRIALGTARALAFLHHGCFPQIIHRDVKGSSIYLDSSLEPRLSDFGLTKISGSNGEDELPRGSTGYTPPEFSSSENSFATSKSDVYGFGVVLFELITGKKPLGDDYPEEKDSNLVNWVRGLVKKNQGSIAIDPKIIATGSESQMEEALKIGYLCTADLPSKRPSMHQIVGLLKDIEPVSD